MLVDVVNNLLEFVVYAWVVFVVLLVRIVDLDVNDGIGLMLDVVVGNRKAKAFFDSH